MREKLYSYGILYALSLVLLAFLLFYIYVEIVLAPYIGFDFEPSTGQILFILKNDAEADLRVGDMLQQVNQVAFSDYASDLTTQLIPFVGAGEILTLRIQRGNEERTVNWVVPGYNVLEFANRAIRYWLLGIVFWLAGVSTILFIRPKDERWRLLIAFYFITAVWLTTGSGSQWFLFRGAIVLRVALWIAIPIYLHLHWVFPQPIYPLPRLVWGILYLASLVMALLQWHLLVDKGLVYAVAGYAIMGSVGLLVLHYMVQPHYRRQLRTLVLMSAAGLLPASLLAVIAASNMNLILSRLGVSILVLIPAAYFYTAYRRHFSDHSLRANRAISLMIYLLMVALGSMLAVAQIFNWVDQPEGQLVVTSALLVGVTALSISFFPAFQRAVERYLLRMPLASEQVAHAYATRITRSLDASRLSLLIQNEILTSLLIHQSALLVRKGSTWQILYAQDVPKDALLADSDRLATLWEIAGVYQSTLSSVNNGDGYGWVRLALPLEFDGDLVGWWLFGRRDPDDFYSPSDIAVLQLLANQTAIALLNIEQAEQLRSLYEANIDRTDVERQELANVIHDEILRHLAILNKSVPAESLIPEFEEAYAKVDSNLRRMTSRLRPVMLEVSLYSALEEMADELEERVGRSTSIHFNVQAPTSPPIYPAKVKEYLFRIVQNACENAVRHAQTTAITISGQLHTDQIELCVEDNGIGFDIDSSLNLSSLLAQQRFGLVSMYERAQIIGAELEIDSRQGGGTLVRVLWHEDPQKKIPRTENKKSLSFL
jgi:signal transduction histidine kinase